GADIGEKREKRVGRAERQGGKPYGFESAEQQRTAADPHRKQHDRAQRKPRRFGERAGGDTKRSQHAMPASPRSMADWRGSVRGRGTSMRTRTRSSTSAGTETW